MITSTSRRALEFVVVGPPRGKGRPRSRVVKGKGRAFASVYTDKATRTYENQIAAVAAEAMNGAPLFEGQLSITIIATFLPPKSVSKKTRAEMLSGCIRPTTKPDWDNLSKCTDALNGIVFRDDSQIVTGRVAKIYGLTPCLKIKVEET
jgi:Holliday junction resolvase RusA-like endonuclease